MINQKPVPFLGLGLQGKSPKVTAQRRVNCYFNFTKDGDRTRVSVHGTPGLSLFVDIPNTMVRGMVEFEKTGKFFAVFGATFYEIDADGNTTNRGTITTTAGRVDMKHNGTEVFLTDNTKAWVYNTDTTAFTENTDGDLPSSPFDAEFLNGRFLFLEAGTGRFWATNSYDGLSVDPGDFATAEYNPDNVKRIGVFRGIIVLFGAMTAEFWHDVGSAGFPFARIPGAAMEWGLAATRSLAPFGDTFIFLARNRMGQVNVSRIEGLQAVKVSDDDLDHLINNYDTVSDATGYSYLLGGHPMYQLNFPAQSVSWLYDGKTQIWSEVQSKGLTRHRGEFATTFGNNTIVADYDLGRLYKLRSDVYTDNGDEINMELYGRHWFSNDKKVKIPTLEIIMESGKGLASGNGSDPQMALAISKDGGKSYGVERWASVGKMGEHTKRVRFRRNGAGRDIVARLRINEPIQKTLIGANWVAEEGLS